MGYRLQDADAKRVGSEECQFGGSPTRDEGYYPLPPCRDTTTGERAKIRDPEDAGKQGEQERAGLAQLKQGSLPESRYAAPVPPLFWLASAAEP